MQTRTKRLLLLLPLLLAAAPLCGAAADNEGDTDRRITHRLGDDVFEAGSRVRVTGDTLGDAIAAGGQLDLAGKVGGDMVAAGGQVSLRNTVAGDLYAAGGELALDGIVAGNARVAGGKIRLSAGAEVTGGMSAAGGEVEIDGRVGRYLQITAGAARIDGQVGGDVEATGGKLEIGPNAVIEGAVTFRGPQPAVVAPGAQVRGTVRHVESKNFGKSARQGLRRSLGVAAWVWTVGWMIVGGIVIAVWPAFAGTVTNTARGRPGMSLLIGLLALIGVPVAIITLMVTLVGIPLALLLLALYLACLPLGYVAGAATLGEWVLQRLRSSRPVVTRDRILALVGALVVLLLLTRIPFVGGLIGLVVLLGGLGSLVLAAVARGRGAAAQS